MPVYAKTFKHIQLNLHTQKVFLYFLCVHDYKSNREHLNQHTKCSALKCIIHVNDFMLWGMALLLSEDLRQKEVCKLKELLTHLNEAITTLLGKNRPA